MTLRSPNLKTGLPSLIGSPKVLWVALAVFTIAIVSFLYQINRADENVVSKAAPEPVEDHTQSGIPGTIGYHLLDRSSSGDTTRITVHHVIASDKGIYVVYSAEATADDGELRNSVQTKSVLDGTEATDSSADILVATDGKKAVRIASLGKPKTGWSEYAMKVAGLDSRDSQSSLSIDILMDPTPDVVEESISMMSHTGTRDTRLIAGGYMVTGSPEG